MSLSSVLANGQNGSSILRDEKNEPSGAASGHFSRMWPMGRRFRRSSSPRGSLAATVAVRAMHRATQIIFAAAMAGCTSPVDTSLTAGEPTAFVATPRVAFYRDYVFATVTPRGEADVERIWRLAEYVLAPHDLGFALHELVILPSTFARFEGEGILF